LLYIFLVTGFTPENTNASLLEHCYSLCSGSYFNFFVTKNKRFDADSSPINCNNPNYNMYIVENRYTGITMKFFTMKFSDNDIFLQCNFLQWSFLTMTFSYNEIFYNEIFWQWHFLTMKFFNNAILHCFTMKFVNNTNFIVKKFHC